MSERDGRPPELGLVARVSRRAGARIAMVLLALLVSSAVYAPFLANDKPYYVWAVDRGACESALNSLAPLVEEWIGSRGSQDAERKAIEAVELRFDTLTRYIDAESEPELGAARDAFVRAKESPDDATRTEAADLAHRLSGALMPELEFTLRSAKSYPLLSSLNFVDWFVALAWTIALALCVRHARARTFAISAAASIVLAALACTVFAPPRVLTSASIKAGIASESVTAESVCFAPIAFGYAETNLTETLRPPTWSSSAELDTHGRYVRGARAQRPDAVTGFTPSATPVDVRPHEPALNSAWRHLFGTDSLGRDILARVLWGGRVSLTVGIASVVLVVLLGLLVGSLAGYFRGRIDTSLTGLVGVLQSFPAFFLILVAIALLPNRGVHPQVATILVIGCVGWTGVARLVRAEALRIRELDYVSAARALGYSNARILLRHVLPNALAPVIVAAAFAVASAILTESAASFLGFGVQPPTPSWGAVMRESRSAEHWWILLFPGLALFATVLACNRIGDGLRDALDPRDAA